MPEVTFAQTEKIDRILEAIINDPGVISPEEMADHLGLNHEEVEHLFYILINVISYQGASVVRPFSGGYISVHYNTKEFLDNGGAKAWFKKAEEKHLKEEKRKELEFENLEIAVAQAKFSKRISIISLIIAGLGIILSIITLIIK